MTGPRKSPGLAAIYELPLSLASLALFFATRWALKKLLNRYHRRNVAQALQWHLLSAEFLARPGALAVFLTTAPRWNPHAIVATAGPLEVRTALSIRTDIARQSASEWFFVLYSHPNRATVATVSCLTAAESGWVDFKIPGPGRFLVGARYYGATANAEFPPMRVDGTERVAAVKVPGGNNDFYRDLGLRGSWFFACLSYHVYPILKYQCFSRLWIDRIFLPVGNPETRFRYGVIEAGERLNCLMDLNHFDTHRFFVTIYSRISLPVVWYEVRADTQGAGQPSPGRGFYLIRIQPKTSGVSPLSSNEWESLVSVLPA